MSGYWYENMDKPVYIQSSEQYSYSIVLKDGEKVELGYSEGANGTPPVTLYKYQESSKGTKKIDALRTAVSNFVDSVAINAREFNVKHRIAIIGYSTNAHLYVGENTSMSKNLAFQDVTTQQGISNLQASINGLSTNGATYISKGITLSNEVFAANPIQADDQNRQRIMIMFTDGEPGQNGYETGEANNTISAAYNAKNQNNATVYTVGIFSNADARIGHVDTSIYQGPEPMSFGGGNHGDKVNRFMHLVSSNYPTAQNVNEDIRNIKNDLPVKDKPQSDDYYAGYYLSASNADELNQAFQSINDSISSPKQQLGETTVLYDEMSPYVALPDDVKESDIKIHTETSTDGGKTWSQDGEATQAKAVFVYDGETPIGVKVNNFDYSENYVVDGQPGKKLVVEIPFTTKDVSYGGNNLPTNADTSGIYNKDGTSCVGNFTSPKLNVPVNYKIGAQDQTIYITNKADLTQLLVYPDKEKDDEFYKPDGVKNRFVDITYTLKQGEEVIGTLTIPAGTDMDAVDAPTWEGKDGNLMSATDIRTCTEYTISCVVTPIGKVDGTLKGEVAGVTTIPAQGEEAVKATVHVNIPKVKVWDTEINMGDPATIVGSDSSNNHLDMNPQKQWVDINGDVFIPQPIGEEPEVKIDHIFVRGTDPEGESTYYPTEDSYFKIKVTVNDEELVFDKNTQQYDLTIYTINHSDTCLGDNNQSDHNSAQWRKSNADFDFIIHVHSVTGILTFTKTLDALSQGDSEARFTIKVDALDDSGIITATYYKTLVFTGDNQRKTFTMELPTGKYKVTELTTGGYQNGSITNADGQSGEEWELTHSGLALRVENSANNPTYPHDKNTAVNSFSYTSNGNWTWTRQP